MASAVVEVRVTDLPLVQDIFEATHRLAVCAMPFRDASPELAEAFDHLWILLNRYVAGDVTDTQGDTDGVDADHRA